MNNKLFCARMFVHFNQCLQNICPEICFQDIGQIFEWRSQLIDSGRALDSEAEGEAAGLGKMAEPRARCGGSQTLAVPSGAQGRERGEARATGQVWVPEPTCSPPSSRVTLHKWDSVSSFGKRDNNGSTELMRLLERFKG